MKQMLILGVVATCLAACQQESASTSTPESTETATVAPAAHVPEQPAEATEVTDATSGATQQAHEGSFNGVLMVPPQQQASITRSMSGSIHEIFVLPGRFVQQGARIATLENPEFVELQQSYLEAAAECEFLEQEYQRQQTLASQEAASCKRLQQSKAEFLAAQSRMQGSKTRLQLLGVQPDQLTAQGILPYLEIKAPISGYVTQIQVNLGTFVPAGETICEVVSKQEYWLQLTAYEKDLSQLKEGEAIAFTVNGLPDRTFEATLLSIDQTVDKTNRSIRVYARVKKGELQFRPGMYVHAWIDKK